MKKVFTLWILLFGGSFIFLVASFTGCQSQRYGFIYRSGAVSLLKNYDVASEGDTIAVEELTIIDSLRFEVLLAANTFSPGNAAYAQIIKDYYTPLEKITDVRVYTIADYNSQYRRGMDMSDDCKFNMDGSDADTKTEIIKALNTAYLSNQGSRALKIVLRTRPANPALHQFVVELHTEVNAVVRAISEPVYVIP